MNKELKFKAITELLSTIVDNRGKTVPTSETGFPLLATNCITHSSIYPVFDKVRYISSETLETWFRSHIEPNDIIFVNKGTPGRVCFVPDPVTFCVAQDMMAFRANPEYLNYKYLYCALRWKHTQKTIGNNHVGLVIAHFRKQDLKNLLIPIRPLIEQESIGNIYLSLSNKIELNNKINTELEAMAKLVYDYWFVQFDFPASAAEAVSSGKPALEGQPYKSSGGKMEYNEELKREIPEGWEVKSLESHINIFDSIRVPLSKKMRSTRKGEYPYYGATSIMDHIDDYLFDDDYILVAEDGSIMNDKGNPIVQFITGKTWVNNHAHVIQAKDVENNEFIFQLVKRISVVQIMTGSIQLKINQENLKGVQCLSPSDSLLKSFANFAKPIRKQLINNINQNQELTSLRDWLLPMLMNGQVTVGEAEAKVKEYGSKSVVSMAAEGKGEYGG
jgi:type I restriction enzyme S subunit